MSSPFVAEIRIFACNFAPTGWAFCNGQLLPISQNTALFSLLGTFYGGDGKSTFALPDLQGRAALEQGQSPGLSEYFLGQSSGSETVTLIQSEMPFHGHSTMAYDQGDPANLNTPDPLYALTRTSGGPGYTTTISNFVQFDVARAIGVSGSSFPHNNMQPYLVLNFCIAMQGVFPPRG
jgi:microcystin-dependent protein